VWRRWHLRVAPLPDESVSVFLSDPHVQTILSGLATLIVSGAAYLKSRSHDGVLSTIKLYVNGRVSSLEARNEQLIKILNEKNIPIPDAPVTTTSTEGNAMVIRIKESGATDAGNS
jgi:hypothetical protein